MNTTPGSARALKSVLLIAALLSTAACGKVQITATAGDSSQLAAPLPAGLTPAASILDLMIEPIDTHADALWEAVAIISTAEGVQTVQPQSEEQWLVLRQKALVLMESANLLVVEGRLVGHSGQKIEGPGDSTDYTPEQAQAEIDKDRATFVAFAAAMQGAGRGLVTAIDGRDVDQYLDAGSALQEACEGCHRRFWYPNSPLPPGL